MSTVQDLHKAWPLFENDAREAYALFVDYCEGIAPIRVPGMDTLYRLALRRFYGRSIEEAAAREYAYRWYLAIRSPTFGVPHAFGM